jgi:8-hydroxy-5-deazaflavin:NADPH oxidoreductase
MKVAIVGAGRIGATTGAKLARAGYFVTFTYSRRPARLEELAARLPGASTDTPAAAVAGAAATLLAVPWSVVADALSQIGPLSGAVVIDATNQFGASGVEAIPDGLSAAEFNSRRAPGARWVKAFNTYTAQFQAEAALRPVAQRAAMFYAGEDDAAKAVAAEIIQSSGFHPIDIGGWAQVRYMEAPRRPGAVYGEEYTAADAMRIVEAIRNDPAEAARLADRLKRAS